MKRKRIILGTAIAAAVLAITAVGFGVANAAVTADPAEVVAISAPRIMDNVTIPANTTQTIDIGGSTINGFTYPAALTGVTLNISAQGVAAGGGLTIWTAGQGKPGNPNVAYANNVVTTTQVDVTTNTAGAIQIANTGQVKVKVGVDSYLLPKGTPPPPVFAAIAANEATVKHIGVSVKDDCGGCAGNGVTDLGKVTLPAGTWDVRVMGGFSGIKSTSVLNAGTQLYGGLFLTKGAGVTAGFANIITQYQGVLIPRTKVGTLTIDPTVTVSDFIVLPVATEVHVSAYVYADDSIARDDSLGLKANVRSAQFLKVS